MSTTPTAVAIRPSALSAMATRFNVEPAKLLDTLKQTVFKNATDAQLMALVIVANEFDLNPFVKEIYAFPDKGGGIVPVISVDGWLKRINTHDQYDGLEKEFVTGADGKPYSCTVTIHRKDRKWPTKHTELYSECYRNTDPWRNQPCRMLGHRTTIQCARVAFGFAGADPDDIERVATAVTVESPRKPIFSTPTALPEPILDADQIPGAEVPEAKPNRAYTRRQTATEPSNETPSASAEAASASEPSSLGPATAPALSLRDRLSDFLGEQGASFDDFKMAAAQIGITTEAKAKLWTAILDVPNNVCSLALAQLEKLAAQLLAQKEA